jgi:hypothetical protein
MDTDYKRRVRNLERAVIALASIPIDTMPPDYQDAMSRFAEDFFYSVAVDGVDGPDLEQPNLWTNEPG